MASFGSKLLVLQRNVLLSRLKVRTYSVATASSSPSSHRILIVGGGPAGSTTAYFLAKAGFDVTVAESSTRPPYGQVIDVTDQAVDVVKRMNLLDKIKKHTTGETGFALLGDAGEEIATLGVNAAEPDATDVDTPASATSEIEIVRGTLTTILADAAKEQQVKFRYGCTVADIQQDHDSITAVLSDTKQPETFTAMIGADGVASQVRQLAFSKEVQDKCFHQTDTFAAYFSMDVDKAERVSYSRFQHGDKGRGLWLRPTDREGGTRASAYFITTSPNNTELRSASSSSATPDQQKAILEKLHSGMSGIRDTVIRGMHECTDWHFTRVVQVKLPTWHVGRCALVGDAAYCPSPLTGQGTSMALIGSYVLAGELAANPQDPNAAFANYRARFEQYVKDEGEIPFGGRAPKIFLPQSQLGVRIVRYLFWRFSQGYGGRLFRLLGSFGGDGENKKFKLPTYPL